MLAPAENRDGVSNGSEPEVAKGPQPPPRLGSPESRYMRLAADPAAIESQQNRV